MITDTMTVGELAAQLAALKTAVRVIPRRVRGGGMAFTIVVEIPGGGSAALTNTSLGAAFETAAALLRFNASEIAPAVADPEGARVGPRPERGTRVGYTLTSTHCAVCGFGEEQDESYTPGVACPKCGGSLTCVLPNGHDDDQHVPQAASS